MKTVSCLTILALLCMLHGCGRTRPIVTSHAVRDSAGITIVENVAPSSADSTSWTLDAARLGLIGGTRQDSGHHIGFLAGFERLSDGTIVVADREAARIGFYDSTGRFLMSAGRPGTGPAEFNYFSSMYKLAGDTILVIDHEGGRRNILTPHGEFVRSYPALRITAPGARFPLNRHVVDYYRDGSYLLGDNRSACASISIVQLVNSGGHYCEDTLLLSRVDLEGREITSFGRMIASRSEVLASPRFMLEVVSGRHPGVFVRVFGDKLFYADARRYEVKVFGRDGRPERIIRASHEPRPPHKSAVIRKAAPDADAAELRRVEAINEAYNRSTWPEFEPAFDLMLIDSAGNIWIQERRTPGENPPRRTRRWYVFDTLGVLTGTVRFPAAFTNIKIEHNHVLAGTRDSLGVQSVELYRLVKNSR